MADCLVGVLQRRGGPHETKSGKGSAHFLPFDFIYLLLRVERKQEEEANKSRIFWKEESEEEERKSVSLDSGNDGFLPSTFWELISSSILPFFFQWGGSRDYFLLDFLISHLHVLELVVAYIFFFFFFFPPGLSSSLPISCFPN
jgi:hypothetical protein